MSPVRARCEALLRAYRYKRHDPSLELNLPVAGADFDRATSWFPARIPEAIRELYAWRNGQPDDAWSTSEVFWFRDMQFTCLERVKSEYESMMSSYGEWNERGNDKVELLTCFPFASFNGGWYVVPCDGHDFGGFGELPVICVFQGIKPYFDSLECMLDACVDWIMASAWGEHGWVLQDEEERFIWRSHNPNYARAKV